MASAKSILKKILGNIIGEYSPYYIYRYQTSQSPPPHLSSRFDIRQIDKSIFIDTEPLLQDQVGYFGDESICYGAFIENRLVGTCFYWFGERYKSRGFWQLKPGEAKLVQIIVLPEARGQSVASTLIQQSAKLMTNAGFSALYARIWHSNEPSKHAFSNAGWLEIAFILEINPFRTKKPWRFHLDRHSNKNS